MRSKRIILWLVLTDGCGALWALWVASRQSWLNNGREFFAIEWPAAVWFLTLMLLWVLASDRLQLDQFYAFRSELMARIVVAMAIASIGVMSLNLIVGVQQFALRVPVFVALFIAIVTIVRFARRAIFVRTHLNPGKPHRTVIIGSGPLARELAIALKQDSSKRYEVIGFLAPEMEEMATLFPNLTTEDTVTTIGVSDFLTKANVDQVCLALPNGADPDILNLVAQCRAAGIAVSFVPHAYELLVTRSVLRNIGGIPLVAVNERQTHSSGSHWKAAADAAVAACLLLFTAPLMVVVAAVLWRTRRCAFRSEARCGVGGKPFHMHRFNIERGKNPANVFEKWLEITSISELPQLFNVIRGEMSIVGPRPETAERVRLYSEWQRQRLDYKPGITGYAQVYGLREKSSSEDKARHDLRYPTGWSPLLDLTMILQTLWIIIRRGSKALLSIPRSSLKSDAILVSMEVSNANSSESSAD